MPHLPRRSTDPARRIIDQMVSHGEAAVRRTGVRLDRGTLTALDDAEHGVTVDLDNMTTAAVDCDIVDGLSPDVGDRVLVLYQLERYVILATLEDGGGSLPAPHAPSHLGDGSDPIAWDAVHEVASGANPATDPEQAGYLRLRTDLNGGTLYVANGSGVWVKASPGVSEGPTGTAAGDLAGTYPSPTVKASVGLTGTPTAPTPSGGDSSTKIATTAFVAGGFIASGATAGGDLSGTYPNPQIGSGVIVNADINASAAIALTKLAQTGQLTLTDNGSGGGIVVSDVALYRGAADRWDTPDGLNVGGTLTFTGSTSRVNVNAASAASTTAFEARVSADSNARFVVRADGQLLWGAGSGAQDIALLRRTTGVLTLGSTSQILEPQNLRVNDTAFTYTGTRAKVLGGSGGLDEVALHVAESATGVIVSHNNTNYFLCLGTTSGGGVPFVGFFARHSVATANQYQNAPNLSGTGPAVRGMVEVYSGTTLDWIVNGVTTADADFSSTKTPLTMRADSGWVSCALGVGTKVKAGTPADGDWTTAPPDGTLVVDSSGNKIWARVGGAWKSVGIA